MRFLLSRNSYNRFVDISDTVEATHDRNVYFMGCLSHTYRWKRIFNKQLEVKGESLKARG